MAETMSGQERTEAATPRRREKEREEGRIARSQELPGAVALLGGIVGLAFAGGSALASHAAASLREAMHWLTVGTLTEEGASALLRLTVQSSLGAIVPFAVAVAGPVLLVNAIQARGVISLTPITPKLSHIDPLKGLKRLLSLEAVVTLVKAIVKLALIGAFAYVALAGAWSEILSLTGSAPPALLAVTRSVALRLGIFTGLAFLAVAAADYGFQLFQHERRMKMTRQEVVQEHKETEGDPLVKSRIRSVAQALARRRMLQQVATADVVVTNPTHIAIALRYDPLSTPAPIVLAMGERKLAERIKAIARKSGVPTVENKPLARALLATGVVGKAIPPALYAAVAEVLAFVYRRRGVMPQAPAGVRARGGVAR